MPPPDHLAPDDQPLAVPGEASLRDDAALLLDAYVTRPLLRGWSHAAAFVASLAGMVALALHATAALSMVASLVYGAGLTAMLGTSALYHRVRWRPRAHRVVQKLDHSMIFVVVASTYTPFVLLGMDGAVRYGVLAAVWVLAIGGVLQRVLVDEPSRRRQVAMYVGLGWAALAIVPAMDGVSSGTLVLAAVGGLLYTVGGIVYLLRRPDPLPRIFGFHEVFHGLVVGAAACHFLAVWPLVTSSRLAG